MTEVSTSSPSVFHLTLPLTYLHHVSGCLKLNSYRFRKFF